MDEPTIVQALDWMRAHRQNRRRMKLGRGAAHLTYCTNIHPGETWDEVRANVETPRAGGEARGSARTGPSGSGLRLSAAAAARAGPARRRWPRFRELLARARALRLHDQRLSLRRLPRHGGQGGGLPPRLARGPERLALHRSRGRRAARPAAAAGAADRGVDQHRARLLPGRGAGEPGAPARDRRAAGAGTRRPCGGSREAGGPPHRRWRSSPSPSACSRPPPTAVALPRSSTCSPARAGAPSPRATGLAGGARRGGPAPPRRPVPGRLPRRGRVRGPGRRGGRAWRPPASASSSCRSAPACGCPRPDAGRRWRARALRRGRLPAPGGHPPGAAAARGCSTCRRRWPGRGSRRPRRRVAHPLPRARSSARRWARSPAPSRFLAELLALPGRRPVHRAPRGRDLHLGRAARGAPGRTGGRRGRPRAALGARPAGRDQSP